MIGQTKPKTNMEKSQLYIDKPQDYYSNVRLDIITLIPDGPNRILDVGCGNGAMLLKLKELGKAKEIFGIELNSSCIDTTKLIAFDGLYFGDIEINDVPFQGKKFDFIIFADILEHLINPWLILQKYLTLLNENGRIIASIPNIKHYSILFNLIFHDKFEYVPTGILDRSHLRFFTKREIYAMFEKENLHIIQMESRLLTPHFLIDKFIQKSGWGTSFFAFQYVIVAESNQMLCEFPDNNVSRV